MTAHFMVSSLSFAAPTGPVIVDDFILSLKLPFEKPGCSGEESRICGMDGSD